jgi:hypothetical protein
MLHRFSKCDVGQDDAGASISKDDLANLHLLAYIMGLQMLEV